MIEVLRFTALVVIVLFLIVSVVTHYMTPKQSDMRVTTAIWSIVILINLWLIYMAAQTGTVF